MTSLLVVPISPTRSRFCVPLSAVTRACTCFTAARRASAVQSGLPPTVATSTCELSYSMSFDTAATSTPPAVRTTGTVTVPPAVPATRPRSIRGIAATVAVTVAAGVLVASGVLVLGGAVLVGTAVPVAVAVGGGVLVGTAVLLGTAVLVLVGGLVLVATAVAVGACTVL